MKNSVIYKLIDTPNRRYVYDRSTNSIIGINDDEYNALNTGSLDATPNSISRLTKNGFLQGNQIETIEHPCKSTIQHHLHHHIQQLTLQVTQKCNLRCKYCVYGGDYNNRSHTQADMSFETAKKAIDIYIKASEESRIVAFSFYGGEPLLRLDLIKQCVEYIKEKLKSRPIVFSITTNATLLTPVTIDYLYSEKFNLNISLDGSRTEHNEYRVFENGDGSFDIIMKHLKDARSRYPDMEISFNTVYNPKHNYENVKKYFEEGEIIADSNVAFNIVEPNADNTNVNFGEQFILIRKYDYLKLFLHLINRLDIQYVSKLLQTEKAKIYKRFNDMAGMQYLDKTAHHGGPCIAGAKRLFVNAHGYIYPCERVPETSEIMKIGHINHGIDIKKAYNLTNIGKITEEQCKYCWALLYCNICCQKADGGNTLSAKVKLSHCKDSKSDAYLHLKELCVLRELGCTFEDD